MATTLTALRDRVEVQLADAGNVTWSTADLDEALRQALDAYSLRMPRRTVVSLTLTQAGREIDVSSLTFTSIEHVWWLHDVSRSGYPPRYVTFEVWPGPLLYVTDPAEPAAGDVLRLWITTHHTLDGLDGATTTTVPEEHATLLAQGAAAFAVLQRRVLVSETLNDNEWAPRNLKEWAEARMAEFRRQLEGLARQSAARAAGLAPGPPLDRWD